MPSLSKIIIAPPESQADTTPNKPIVVSSHEYGKFMIFSLIFMILFFGLTTNSYLTYVFSKKRKNLKKNFLTINLSVINILASLSYVVVLKRISIFKEKPANQTQSNEDKIWCELEGGLMAYFSFSAILQLAFVSAERAIMIICRPLETRHKILGCILMYILSCCLVIPTVFGWGEIKESKNKYFCCFDFTNRSESNRIFIMYIFVLGYFAPSTVIIVSYGLIWNKVRTARNRLNFGENLRSRLRKEELHFSRLMVLASVAFNLSWAYFAILALNGQFGDQSLLTPGHVTAASLLAKSFVLNNPLIYGFMDRGFRKDLKNTICCTLEDRETAALIVRHKRRREMRGGRS